MVHLSPELVREVEQAGDQPLSVENPDTKRVYIIVDAELYDVVRRPASVPFSRGSWTVAKNQRRCELIRKKFSHGINAQEAHELGELQGELSSYRKQAVPLPYDIADVLEEALNIAPTTSPMQTT